MAWLRYWGPVVMWMAVTFYLSHQSVVAIPLGAPDYIAHGVGYAGLGALLVRALTAGRLSAMSRPVVLTATLIAGVYGMTDEFHQSFVPGRNPSVSDLAADTLGALVGASLVAGLRRFRPSGATRR